MKLNKMLFAIKRTTQYHLRNYKLLILITKKLI